MSQQNFIDFQMKILNGIDYGKLSTTSRAYQWIKNNNTIDGPCLNYLKDHISHENFVTQKELNLFKSIVKDESIPKTEAEIDIALASYFDQSSPIVSLQNVDINCIENELVHAENYLKGLNSSEKILLRSYNKLDVEINQLKQKRLTEEGRMKNTTKRLEIVNESCNVKIKKIEQELSLTESILSNILKNTPQEYNLFQIDFETFKKINCTFRDAVNVVVDKQFEKVNEAETSIRTEHDNIPTTITDTENNADFSFCGDSYADKAKNEVENLVKVAYCLGQRSLKHINFKCEETELTELSNYIKNLMSEINSQNMLTFNTSARLQSQTSINNEAIEDTKQKVKRLQSDIENYYKNHVLDEIFVSERFRMEQKLKSDKKRFRKISELCSKFVDLITFQACLMENEKVNVNTAIMLYDRAYVILEELHTRHNDAMINLNSMFRHRTEESKNEKFVNPFTDLTCNILRFNNSETEYDIETVFQKCPNFTTEIFSQILKGVNDNFEHIQSLHYSIRSLDRVIFDGPARQPFFTADLSVEKRIIEIEYTKYSKMLSEIKTKYYQKLKELSSDEYSKLEKLLWIRFLLDPKTLQEEYVKLRKNAGANKTVIMKKNETLTLTKKTNRSTYY